MSQNATSIVPNVQVPSSAANSHIPKTDEEVEKSDQGIRLKKGMGLLNAIAMIVGVVIGSGIFVSPGGVIRETGSPGLALIVWSMCGLFSTLGAICYAELGTSIPKSGGDFAYINTAFGQLPSFLYLWVAIVVIIPTGNAITALTFANYVLQPIFGQFKCTIGSNQTLNVHSDDLEELVHANTLPVRLIAMACTSFLIYVNCYNVNWATKIQNIFTITKLAALGLIITLGVINIFRDEKYRYPNIDCIYYVNRNYLTFVTEELQDPYKNLPHAIYISLPLVTIVYVLTNLAYFTVMSPLDVETSKAVAVTFAEKSTGKISWLIQLLVAASTFGGLNGCIFTSSRLFFVGAREGQLPKMLTMVNINKYSPIPSILFTGGLSILMCVFDDVLALINYTSFVESAFMACSIGGLMWLRFRDPQLYRPIKVSLLVPMIVFVNCTFLLIVPLITSPQDCGIGLILIVSGVPVYYLTVAWTNKPKFIRSISGGNYIFGYLAKIR